MKRTVYYPEIFEMVGNATSEEEKIAILHKFKDEKGFFDILVLCYDPKIEWAVTREEIENLRYIPMDIPDYDLAPSTLFLEARRRLYNYTNKRQPPLKKYKILQLIAGMFSTIYFKEVELFKQMVDHDINEITESLVRKAFPGLLSASVEIKEVINDSNKEKVTKEIKEEIKEDVEVKVQTNTEKKPVKRTVKRTVKKPVKKAVRKAVKKAVRKKPVAKKMGRPKGSPNKPAVKPITDDTE